MMVEFYCKFAHAGRQFWIQHLVLLASGVAITTCQKCAPAPAPAPRAAAPVPAQHHMARRGAHACGSCAGIVRV